MAVCRRSRKLVFFASGKKMGSSMQAEPQHVDGLTVFLLDVFSFRRVVVSNLRETRGQVITLELFERTFGTVDVFDEHVNTRVVTLLGHVYYLVEISYSCKQITQANQSAATYHGSRNPFEFATI